MINSSVELERLYELEMQATKRRKEAQRVFDEKFEKQVLDAKTKVSGRFQTVSIKFILEVSEDGKFLELKNSLNDTVATFDKNLSSKSFVPIHGAKIDSCSSTNEHIVLCNAMPDIYKILNETFV